jgi:hypothetical protein
MAARRLFLVPSNGMAVTGRAIRIFGASSPSPLSATHSFSFSEPAGHIQKNKV